MDEPTAFWLASSTDPARLVVAEKGRQFEGQTFGDDQAPGQGQVGRHTLSVDLQAAEHVGS